MIAALLVGLLAAGPTPALAAPAPVFHAAPPAAAELYREMRLEGVIGEAAFTAAYESVVAHGLRARVVAIADMSQPSTAHRFYLFDLDGKKLVLRTLVAHGSGSGELMAERFSNRVGSRQTSLGLYRVGAPIVSPKWGPALLLDGLDRGVNDRARAREVILHGASWAGPEYVALHGRLGRSWGCPTVPVEDVPKVIDLLRDGGLLYVYGL